MPQRRRGARVGGRDRRRVPGGDRPAAVREALAGRLGHRRGRARGRSGRRRRPLARQHDARPGARPSAPACARTGDGRLLGTGAEADRARRGARLPARDGAADRRHGRCANRPRRAGARCLRSDRRRARHDSLRRPGGAGARASRARRGARARLVTICKRCRRSGRGGPGYRLKRAKRCRLQSVARLLVCRTHGAAPEPRFGPR